MSTLYVRLCCTCVIFYFNISWLDIVNTYVCHAVMERFCLLIVIFQHGCVLYPLSVNKHWFLVCFLMYFEYIVIICHNIKKKKNSIQITFGYTHIYWIIFSQILYLSPPCQHTTELKSLFHVNTQLNLKVYFMLTLLSISVYLMLAWQSFNVYSMSALLSINVYVMSALL